MRCVVPFFVTVSELVQGGFGRGGGAAAPLQVEAREYHPDENFHCKKDKEHEKDRISKLEVENNNLYPIRFKLT